MIQYFLQLLLKEILQFLQEHENFFTLPSEEKISLTNVHFALFPKIAAYLVQAEEISFLEDIKEFTVFMSEHKKSEHNRLLKVIVETCIFDVSRLLDGKATFASDTTSLSKQIQTLLTIYSTQEISSEVQRFIESVSGCAYIVVQSPTMLSMEIKQDIRKKLFEKYSSCFPTFSVQKNLIGGLRILVNGQTTDLSWYGKIMQLSQLLYQRT